MNSEQVSLQSFAEAGARLCGPDATELVSPLWHQHRVVTLMSDVCLLLAKRLTYRNIKYSRLVPASLRANGAHLYSTFIQSALQC